jgi:hypothetical protein
MRSSMTVDRLRAGSYIRPESETATAVQPVGDNGLRHWIRVYAGCNFGRPLSTTKLARVLSGAPGRDTKGTVL